MRIYAVADIHGQPDKIKLILANTLQLNPDVLVVAGDIASYTGSAEILAQLNDIPVPVLAVRGNTDLPRIKNLLQFFSNISLLHLKQVTVCNTHFIGVSGCIPIPFSSRICLNQTKVVKELKPLIKSNSVLVAHPPPWGTLDKVLGRFHAGCRGLKKVINICRPMLMICGHIHESFGSVLFEKTIVVNCAIGNNHAGAIIELGKDKNIKVEML